MALFDVLRWHVSIPPTAEELNAIPTKLYRSWIKHHACHWRDADTESSFDTNWVSGWMYRNWESPRGYMIQEEIVEDINLLRKLIAEWGE